MLLPRSLPFLCLCVLAASSASAQLVPNGQFQQGADGKLDAWMLGEQPPKPITETGTLSSKNITVSWDKAPGGRHALKFSDEGKGADFALAFSPRVPVHGGDEYEFKVTYRATGLLPPDPDRQKHTGAIAEVFFYSATGQVGPAPRFEIGTNTTEPATLQKTFRVPEGAVSAAVRVNVTNQFEKSKLTVWYDSVSFEPVDKSLSNPGFEAGSGNAPADWTPIGSARCDWVHDLAHSGKACVAVANAPNGALSGWTAQFPVRSDRKYSVAGYIKTSADLSPNDQTGGGVLVLEFLGSDGQPIATPVVSPPVGPHADWTAVQTLPIVPPAGAVQARIAAGLRFTNGTAYFDDLSLTAEPVASTSVAQVHREHPTADPGVKYAVNLLANGTAESGTPDGKLSNWHYSGKSTPDWTPAEIDRVRTAGRPDFSVGRGEGVWAQDLAYSGKRSLLNISIDPPFGPKPQWYGRGPVDGFWLSDAMPVQPGKAYMTAGWIHPGQKIEATQMGPLEIRFYDAAGKQVRVTNPKSGVVHTGLADAPAGVWSYWAMMPSIAPDNAATMRLRFGQEYKADAGGWGRTYADNLAVWEVPSSVPLPDFAALSGRTSRFKTWYRSAVRDLKPPYSPAPTDAIPYETTWAFSPNVRPGNLYSDPEAPATVRFELLNLLGEARDLSVRATRYDAYGNQSAPVDAGQVHCAGASEGIVDVTLPPTHATGAFYVDAELLEGGVSVGHAYARYAVMPPLERKHTAYNPWGVTPLLPVGKEDKTFDQELGHMMQVDGFGLAWVRINYDHGMDDQTMQASIADAKSEIAYYKTIGLPCVLQLMPTYTRPVDRALYEGVGKLLGTAFRGQVLAISNYGVEMANSKSGFRTFGGGLRVTDEEWDTIMAAQYDGIKSVAPEMTVTIGNIASDPIGSTVKRLYGHPGDGKFDGATINSYGGQLTCLMADLKEFDAHNDHQKGVWLEEEPTTQAPIEGPGRRYGEMDACANYARTALTLIGKGSNRLKAFTIWSFGCEGYTSYQEVSPVTPTLQPRPQFVTQAVLSDALADAALEADLCQGDVSTYAWKRADGRLLAAWANAGERDLTLEAPAGRVTVTDLMGNRQTLPAAAGLVTLHLSTRPVLVSGGGALTVSHRLTSAVEHGDIRPGESRVRLVIQNHQPAATTGQIFWHGPVTQGQPVPFSVAANGEAAFETAVNPDQPVGKRVPIRAEIRCDDGAVFSASASLNFAQAVFAATPPALDGGWQDWSAAPVVEFGHGDEVGGRPDDYHGPQDILGRLRLLWDRDNLYLGVEALDDKFVSVPGRGRRGFLGDSIEFGVQPEAVLAPDAAHVEYEIYLPADDLTHPCASRRTPPPANADDLVTNWHLVVKPTGVAGNVNYQAAIPWADLGVKDAAPGRTISLSMVLNDADEPGRFTGDRKRIRWFQGVDGSKNPEGYGDVTLVQAPGEGHGGTAPTAAR